MKAFIMALALTPPLHLLAEEDASSPPEKEEREERKEEKEEEEMAQESDVSCEDGNLEECYRLGNEEYKSGSIDEAKDLLGQACNDGFMKACSGLGLILEKEGDTASATGIYQKACGQGFSRACAHLNRLGLGRQGAARLPASVNKGGKASDDALEGLTGIFLKACASLHNMRMSVAMGKSPSHLGQSCRAGNPIDCLDLANMKQTEGDRKESEELLRLSFRSKIKIAGDRLGRIQEKTSPDKALATYTEACNEGFVMSCTGLGVFEDRRGNKEKAKKIFTKSCAAGEARACRHLGKIEEEGGDRPKAKDSYLKSCKLGNIGGCREFVRLDVKDTKV